MDRNGDFVPRFDALTDAAEFDKLYLEHCRGRPFVSASELARMPEVQALLRFAPVTLFRSVPSSLPRSYQALRMKLADWVSLLERDPAAEEEAREARVARMAPTPRESESVWRRPLAGSSAVTHEEWSRQGDGWWHGGQ